MKEFDLSSVRYSRVDEEKGIILPKKLTEDLAEDIGIHIGDGSLYLSGKNRSSSEFHYSGNILEKEYIEYILNLKKKLYNISRIREYKNSRKTEIGFRFSSLALATFYTSVFKMPIGKKSKIVDVPQVINGSKNNKFLAGFLRGIVDTDFSLTYKNKGKAYSYPVLHGGLANKALIKSIARIFKKLGFKIYVNTEIKHFDIRTKKTYYTSIIDLNGKDNLIKYFSKIGFNNPKNNLKYLVWKKLGYCPPRSSLDQLKKLINGRGEI